jgi:hypothetical protein
MQHAHAKGCVRVTETLHETRAGLHVYVLVGHAIVGV